MTPAAGCTCSLRGAISLCELIKHMAVIASLPVKQTLGGTECILGVDVHSVSPFIAKTNTSRANELPVQFV